MFQLQIDKIQTFVLILHLKLLYSNTVIRKGQNYGKAKDSKYTHTDTTLDLAALCSVSQLPEIQYLGPSFTDTVLLFIMSTAYTSESRKFGENNQMMDAPG